MAICNPSLNPSRPASVGPVIKRVTSVQQRWAASLANDVSIPIGAIFVKAFDGSLVVAWVTCHSYTVNADGSQTPGAYHGVSLHEPTASTPIPDLDPVPEPMPAPAPTTGYRPSFIELTFLATAIFGTTFAAARAFYEHKAKVSAKTG